MNGVARFEDLIAWQKARALTREIYGSTRAGPFSRDFGLRDQTRSAAVSVMSNIAEGFERGTPGEFHHFLCTSKGSCAELRSELYVALDAEYLNVGEFDVLHDSAEEVARLVGGLRASAERRRKSTR
jgi:four helix bundle protein